MFYTHIHTYALNGCYAKEQERPQSEENIITELGHIYKGILFYQHNHTNQTTKPKDDKKIKQLCSLEDLQLQTTTAIRTYIWGRQNYLPLNNLQFYLPLNNLQLNYAFRLKRNLCFKQNQKFFKK